MSRDELEAELVELRRAVRELSERIAIASDDAVATEKPVRVECAPTDDDLRDTARRLDDALHGRLAPEQLTRAENIMWNAMFSLSLGRPSPEAERFFADRERRGLGVGLDDHGNLVWATSKADAASR
ncbi:hypothetical protein [Roseivivax marinus]|uniref:hypothetical protein n=1 Tax=Roseivivax marinus TaxID=1379903 RepID=UPI00273F51D2|nr:hypothetical protein [Roseivivax marinus]